MAKGKLVLLGSGETAPGMTKVHRELLSGLGEVRAVNLDSPYGFQLNVPQMTQKLVDYFKVSLQTDLKPLSFTNYEKSSGVERELFRQSVREANYVFAGPGSPSYALAQWKGLDLQEDLLHVLDNGGVVCFSSAAALTLGAFTAPIYEIYKAGAKPYWLEGLNLMGLLGIDCAIIPHFNNAEGQDYDTSCCYLGVERLELLDDALASEVAILGIDEHTAFILELETKKIHVIGKGEAFWRNEEVNQRVESVFLGSHEKLFNQKKVPKKPIQQNKESDVATPLELGKLVEEGGDQSQIALARLVTLAGDSIEQIIGSNLLIELILQKRRELKDSGNYELADQLREVLLQAQITIEDTPSGSIWKLNK